MRRIVGILVTAGVVAALAGGAAAETVPVQTGTPARTAPGPTDGATGTELVGTVERVTRTLGYLGGQESTTFRHPGASYMKLHFARALLLPGDHVTVSDPKRTEVHRYDGRAAGWAMSVTGDTAVVEIERSVPDPLGLRSASSPLSAFGVTVDRVARGFTPTERAAAKAASRERERGTGREESICRSDDSRDAVCYRSSDPATYQRSKAVVRLLINGNELCTGWRIGPHNRLVTNNHCFADSDTAYNTEVWFNYQCAACGGFAVFRPTKVWGDRVLYTSRTLDVTLFTVERFPDIQKFGYLELDRRRAVAGEELIITQHPAGEPARIARSSDADRAGNCAVSDPLYDGYAKDSDVSYYCDTEGGSSGSPVLSRRTGRVIALHHFGGCPNSGVRADLLGQRLARLL